MVPHTARTIAMLVRRLVTDGERTLKDLLHHDMIERSAKKGSAKRYKEGVVASVGMRGVVDYLCMCW